MSDIVIVSAARTPVGSFNGALSSLPAHELGKVAIQAALERAGVAAADVDEVILGHVLQAGAGQGPARQASVNAGIPEESPAWSLNQLCGSGLRAVALGAQQIADGAADIVVAGGQESMSQVAPRRATCATARRWATWRFVDTMIKDGLWDAFHGYHMGQTAENIAARWQITREDQDRFAVASQNRAEAAQKAGKFAGEIAPVTIKGRKGDTVVDQDEYIRHGATYEAIGGPAPGLQQGRLRHRRQRLRPQRRRRGPGADERRGGQDARPEAAGAHRLLGQRRRRSGDHGHRARSRPAARRWSGRAGRSPTSTWSNPTRPSPPSRSAWCATSASTRRRSTSTAAPSPSATRSARPARGS